ncbi:BTAD domain-containing putative transcriptional regulator [Kibdelosporangium lantanae]
MTDLRFLLLGALEVRRGADVLPIRSSKLRVLLATLLLSPRRTVPLETLIERLWGDEAAPTARSTLHVYVLRLRRLLEMPDLIRTGPNGYILDVPDDQVDIGVFGDLVARSREAATPLARWELLTEALALWRGAALADVPSESIQRNVVPRLVEERLQAVERRAEIGITLGMHEKLVAELTELTVTYPLRERMWLLLLDSLWRSGRNAEALVAYQRVRKLFADELGVDPSDALQRLHLRILADDGPVPAAQPVVRPAQLPPDVRAFAGRAELVTTLLGELTAGGMPLALVTGPPGVGKTALAAHVAHLVKDQFPDGQLYVNLHGYSAVPPVSETVVLSRFLHALGVPGDRHPADVEDQTNLYRSLLADRRVLVMLDNTSGPDQVRRLLPGQPGCAVLITSRDDLRGLIALDGGRLVPLEPLLADESTAVLADVIGQDRVADEPDAVATLVDQCAGLPLALRIAGANLRTRPHQPIAAYVADLGRGRLNQLRVPGDENTAVQATFDLSYARLDPNSAALFRRLSRAPGPDFSVPVAAALMACPVDQAARLLDTLAARNLIFASGQDRYQMHDLLREYATKRALDDPEADAAGLRVLDFYLRTADAASKLLYPDKRRAPWEMPDLGGTPLCFGTEAEALAWFDDERVNLGAAASLAAETGVERYGWHLADATYLYFSAAGHAVDALVINEAALVSARASNDVRVEPYVLDFIGSIYFRTSNYAKSERYHAEALALSRAAGDLYCQTRCLRHLGRVSAQAGTPDRTVQLHQEALALAVKGGYVDEQALNTNYIGLAHQSAGRPDDAVEWHDRALELSVRLGNDAMRCRVHNGLGLAAWHRGDYTAAITHQRTAIDVAVALRDRHLQASSLICLAEALCAAGEPAQAIEQATAAVDLRTGERRIDISATEIITTARAALGDTDGVIDDYLGALREAEEIDFRYGQVSVLVELAGAYRRAGSTTWPPRTPRRRWR